MDLVLAARAGDKRAFVEIVTRHQAMVCGIALGILGDFASSEDAGQDAFLTAWRRLSELREPERLRPWLGQIARNAALAHLRRRRGHAVLEEDAPIRDAAPQPDEAAVSQEEAALVRETLARLPETYRLPLILFYREGQSVHQAAAALGIGDDALKQRLARGREMLRARMSARIETVLARTVPTAVFTMAVAAALGALAPPAAMAGSAFAAAAASGTSGTPSMGASLLSAMSTSKAVLVSACLIAGLFVPIGYSLRPALGSRIDRASPSPASGRVAPAARSAADGLGVGALVGEWRALHDRLGTNAAAMPRLYEAIAGLEDSFRRRAFRAALIAEWVEVDPVGGLPFFLAEGRNRTQRRQFFEEWLGRDPRTAVDRLLVAGPGWETMARECLQAMARLAPDRVSQVVARLPKAEGYWEREVQEAFEVLASRDLPGSRQSAETLSGDNRNQALEGVAQAWGRADFTAALAWVRGLPEGLDRDELIRAALVGRAAVDPAGALDSVGLVPAGGRYAHFATTTGARVLAEAARGDFEQTARWVAAHPGMLGHDDLLGLASAVTERLNADPAGFLGARLVDGSLSTVLPAVTSALLNDGGGQREAVWDWLGTQPTTPVTEALRGAVLDSAAYQDPRLALRLVADLPPGPEGDERVLRLARCLFNGGSAIDRFETLYGQASERLKPALVEAAFVDSLRGDTLDDPWRWAERLALVPVGRRAAATAALAGAWAGQNPEEALGWATSGAAGAARIEAVAAAVGAWAGRDAQGAAEWVATLPGGIERDRGTESLAIGLAATYPQAAWEWALSIGDPGGRLRAATGAIERVAARDPATARRWIETAPFTAGEKAQLQVALHRAGRRGR